MLGGSAGTSLPRVVSCLCDCAAVSLHPCCLIYAPRPTSCVVYVSCVSFTAGEFADANEELLKSLPPPYVAVQYYLSGALNILICMHVVPSCLGCCNTSAVGRRHTVSV